jgi:hypothetical protein
MDNDVLIFFLSCSNWGTETDPEFKGYHNGNSDPRGFGNFLSTLFFVRTFSTPISSSTVQNFFSKLLLFQVTLA